jgi:hypothetical protein
MHEHPPPDVGRRGAQTGSSRTEPAPKKNPPSDHIYASMEEALRHLPEDGYVIVSHGLNGDVRILRDTRTPEDHRATLRRQRQACAMARPPRRREPAPTVHLVRRAHGSSGRPRARLHDPRREAGTPGPTALAQEATNPLEHLSRSHPSRGRSTPTRASTPRFAASSASTRGRRSPGSRSTPSATSLSGGSRWSRSARHDRPGAHRPRQRPAPRAPRRARRSRGCEG